MLRQPKPLSQQRAKPNLFIDTEFESEDDATHTVAIHAADPLQEQWANQCIDGLSLDQDQQDFLHSSVVEDLQQPEQLHRRCLPHQQGLQSMAIGFQTLSIFQKLWKRRMYIECFNCLRLARRSSLSRQRSQVQLRRHKHSASVLEPPRTRWQDRSVNRAGSTLDQDTSIERARLLNEIAEKLSHRSSNHHYTEHTPVAPTLVPAEAHHAALHQRVVESKLDRLEMMLRDIKKVNEASTNRSTVYSIRRPELEPRRKKAREEVDRRQSRRDREIRQHTQFVEHSRSIREDEQQKQLHNLSKDISALREEVRQLSGSRMNSQSPNALGQLFERREKSPSPQAQHFSSTQHFGSTVRNQFTTYIPVTVTSPTLHQSSTLQFSKSPSTFIQSVEPRSRLLI